MALTYQIFSQMDTEALQMRLASFQEIHNTVPHWSSIFVEKPSKMDIELLEEEGIRGLFNSYFYVRLKKNDPNKETNLVRQFFNSLPEPKVIQFEGETLEKDEWSARVYEE